MYNLFLLNDFITNGFKIEFVDIIYIVSILLGVFTIINRNPIVSVLFLIGLFLNIACLLILVGYNYIGLSYILVYVGAVVKCKNNAAQVKILLYKVLLIIKIVSFMYLNKSLIKGSLTNPFWTSHGTVNKNRLIAFHKTLYISQTSSNMNYLSASNKKLYSTMPGFDSKKVDDSEFLKWFVGFSDAESNFNIIIYNNKDGNVTSVTFRFAIELHIDDLNVLNFIRDKLNIGNKIAIFGNSCKFTVTHPEDIYLLTEIFDKYNLNTTKYLDYLD